MKFFFLLLLLLAVTNGFLLLQHYKLKTSNNYMVDQHNDEIEYESIREKDIPKIAQMIAKNFDGPFEKWQFLLEAYSVWTSTVFNCLSL
jgi:hypothetical protein